MNFKLSRRKRRPAQAADVIVGALELGALYKTAKGSTKSARKAAKGTAAYKAGKAAAKRTPGVRRLPIVLAAGGAGIVAIRKLRSSDGQPTPTQATPPPATAATIPG